MEATQVSSTSETAQRRAGVLYLHPDKTKIFKGTYNLMHLTISGPDSRLERGVFAVRAFPVSHPDKFISLRHTDPLDNREHEIGVIEDINEFPEDVRKLVLESLGKHYLELQIRRIREIRWEYNLLFFEVETHLGRMEFMMRWSYDRAQNYGEHGKVLLDVYANRYIIPDVNKLAKEDLDLFQRWIYW